MFLTTTLTLLVAQNAVSPEFLVEPQVTPHVGHATRPALGFNGHEYLVTWDGARPDGVFAQRLDVDGRALDTPPLRLAPTSTGARSGSAFVASNGTDFLVLLRDGLCVPISAGGLAGAPIYPFAPTEVVYSLGLVFDGTRYLAAYSAINDSTVHLIHLADDCRALDAPLEISRVHVVPETACPLATNGHGTELFLCSDSFGVRQLWVLGPTGILSQSDQPLLAAWPRLSSDGNGFLLTYSLNGAALAQRFDASGAALDRTPLELSSHNSAVDAQVFASGAYSILVVDAGSTVVRRHLRLSADPGVVAPPPSNPVVPPEVQAMGAVGPQMLLIGAGANGLSGPAFSWRLDPDGSLGPATPLFEEADRQESLSVGAYGADFVVTWASRPTLGWSAISVDPAGLRGWPSPTQLAGQASTREPLGSTLGWLVTSEEGRSIRLDPAGAALDPAPFDSGGPCTYDGASYRCLHHAVTGSIALASFGGPGTMVTSIPSGLRIGSAIGSPLNGLLLASGGGKVFAGSGWDSCVVLGKGQPDCQQHSAWALIDAASGATQLVVPPVPRDTWAQRGGLVFFNGAEFVVLTGLQGMVTATRVSLSGGILASGLVDGLRGLTGRAAGRAAGRPFVAWEVDENIVGSWIAPDGSFETPAGFRIVGSAHLDDAAANDSGQAAVVYTRYFPELPYQTTRGALKLIRAQTTSLDGGVQEDGGTMDKDAEPGDASPIGDAGASPSAAGPAGCGCATNMSRSSVEAAALALLALVFRVIRGFGFRTRTNPGS